MDDPGDFLRRVGGVDAFQWNPLRPDPTSATPRLLNNFGDLLGPLVVELELARIAPGAATSLPPERRVVSVGSVMHLARPRDVIWGTGINGKVSNASVHGKRLLDVRAVRGPWSAAYMTARGIEVPAVYGDPALLLPELMPELRDWATAHRTDVLVAPNFNDLAEAVADSYPVLVPTNPLRTVLRTIAQSRFVVGSSLHAVVIADALGIDARFVASANESTFKYRDYLAGTGRPFTRIAPDVATALAWGPHEPLRIDLDRLAAAFPRDVWELGLRTTGWAGRPFELATFPQDVLDDVLRAFTGQATHDELVATFRERLADAASAAAHDGEQGEPAVEHAATYRELLVPELDVADLTDDEREQDDLVVRRDTTRLALCARVHGTPVLAELRAVRGALGGVVVSLSVQCGRVRGLVRTIALELTAQGTDRTVVARVPTSPFHGRQWHIDVDCFVPAGPLADAPRWDVHVLISDGDGVTARVPLAPRGSLGLVLDPWAPPSGQAPAQAWVLDVPSAVA
ncbi:polysaccharide pyruvyl transferase family protein [Cellulomonas composti]|uniref:Polysaccharide pyruvyl transferase domain-containing protein n=1 Tax=Cellulomonas composti TaxID=266130 RepID=A0A511JB19_9CELL|nr:polysaccharide pyruvyl transferase family protein [Cellulomonas composti]GEL95185.1 hypothetical protein CCO02nite_18430 [Cellulomonas composti]